MQWYKLEKVKTILAILVLSFIIPEILSTPKRKTDPVALKKAKAAYKSCVDRTQLNGLWYYEKPERKIIEKFGMPLVDNNQLTKINWTQIGEISSWFGIQQMFEFVVKNFTPEDYILIVSFYHWRF